MANRSELTARRVFVALIVISLLLLGMVVLPFASAFFLAAVLAGALWPIEQRLARALRGHRSLSASILVVAVVLLLVVPIAGIAAVVVKEATQGYRFVSQTLRSEGVEGLLGRLPDRLERQVRRMMDRFDVTGEESLQALNEELGEQVQEQGGAAAQAVTGAMAATGSLLVQAVFMLIALFFFLTDGKELVAWLERVSPLKEGQTLEILVEFRKVSVAVMVSSLATAGVQALVAMVGYFIARVPQVFFFTLVTFFVALIPAIGAAAVCLAAALLLFATGRPWAALFLVLWGLLVVGLVDNVVKPLLVKRDLSLHGAVVFFALLGGLAFFGTVGLLLGPMIVAFFLALIRIHQRDYGDAPRPALPVTQRPSEETVPGPSPATPAPVPSSPV